MKKLLIAAAILSTASVGIAADLAAGKTKNNSVCTSCHGADGKLGVSGAKDISGKSTKYIYNKLVAYKAGTIKAPMAAIMSPMASLLSDTDMHNVAAHISKTIK